MKSTSRDTLNISYRNRVRQFRKGYFTSPRELKEAVLSFFDLTDHIIEGFVSKEGLFITLDDLYKRPLSSQHDVFTLVVKPNESIRPSTSKMTRFAQDYMDEDLELMSQSSVSVMTDRKNYYGEAIEISNFESFLSKLSHNDQGAISIVLLTSNYNELEQVCTKFEELIAPYSAVGDSYYYVLQEGDSPEDRIEYRKLPGIAIYSGGRRVKLLGGQSSWSGLGKFLKTIQRELGNDSLEEDFVELGSKSSFAQSVTAQSRHGGNSGSKANSGLKIEDLQRAGTHLFDELLRKGHINEKEFYFLKCQALEGDKGLLTQINTYLRTSDQREIFDFLVKYLYSNGIRSEPSKGSRRSKSRGKEANATNENGHSRSRNLRAAQTGEISTLQEKFIFVVAELEDQLYLTEEVASTIKSLILEENPDVLRTLKNHLREPLDTHTLKKQLLQLVQRHKDAAVRPASPLREKDQVIKLAETLFRQRIKDESYIYTLQKLVSEKDELIFSAFDVFKSDHDEDDFFDTLSRIIQLHHQKMRSKHQAEGYLSGSQKQLMTSQRMVNNYIHTTQDEERGRKLERTRSKESANGVTNGGLSRTKSPVSRDFSYFLRSDNPSQSNSSFYLSVAENKRPETAAQKVQENRAVTERVSKQSENKQIFIEERPKENPPQVLSSSKRNDPSANENIDFIKKALKLNEQIRGFDLEVHGMLFHLLAKEKEIILDVVADNGGWEQLDRAIPSLKAIAKKKWEAYLYERFSSREREVFKAKKTIPNSAVYASLQCFKYDSNLDELTISLNQYFRELNLPKDNEEQSLSKADPRKTSNETKQSNESFIPEDATKNTIDEELDKARKEVAVTRTNKSPSFSDPRIGESGYLRLLGLNVFKKEDSPSGKLNKKDESIEEIKREETKSKEPTSQKKEPSHQAIVTEKIWVNPPEAERLIQSKKSLEKIKESLGHSLGGESEQGDLVGESRVMQSSIADGLEQQRTPARERLSSTPGSKYTPLLKVDRQESMRGFQLKLVSSESVATTPRSSLMPDHGPSSFSKQDTQGPAELRNRSASLHVLIPAKEEKNEVEKVYINKFHETVDEKNYHKEKFQQLVNQANFLTEIEIDRLRFLMEHHHTELFTMLLKFEKEGCTEAIKAKLKELVELDPESLSICSSPTEKKRLYTYNLFKTLLKNLKENDKMISERQFKSFLYLYMEEEMSVLACHEVYLFNGDIKEFLDTLGVIEKVQFFNKDSEFMEKISDYDELVQEQMRIIYSLNKYLNLDTRITLEKIIRAGDTTVNRYYEELRKTKVTKSEFIHRLVKFAEEKAAVITRYEMSVLENKIAQSSEVNRRKETIENFENGKFMKGLPHMNLIYDMIEQDDAIIHGIFEVYDATRDKNDFIENIKVLHTIKERGYIIDILTQELDFDDHDIESCRTLLKKKDSILSTALKVFNVTKDKEDFLNTVELIKESEKL